MWALGLTSLNLPFFSLPRSHILTDMLGEEITSKYYHTIVVILDLYQSTWFAAAGIFLDHEGMYLKNGWH
jgi:hypothetical protein